MSDHDEQSDGSDASLWHRLRSRRSTRWAMDIAIVVAVVLAVSAYQSRHLLDDDDPVPPFELESLDGQTFETDQLEADRTIIYFWATWCSACDLQAGAISALHDRAVDDPDLEVVSVVLDYGDRREVQAHVDNEDIDFPVYLGTRAVAEGFEVESYPTTYIVDDDGQIRHGLVGYTTRPGLIARLWI